MSDVFTPKKRSEVMSRVRGKGNLSTEVRMITLMRQHKIAGWRRGRKLPGSPDFVFPIKKVAVFVDGCFWHGCPVHYTAPVTSSEFWRLKVTANRRRDRRVDRELQAQGWQVIRIWEHDLRKKAASTMIVRFRRALRLESLKEGLAAR
jgi:DNA mismatch endonuclease (patch repair protein)